MDTLRIIIPSQGCLYLRIPYLTRSPRTMILQTTMLNQFVITPPRIHSVIAFLSSLPSIAHFFEGWKSFSLSDWWTFFWTRSFIHLVCRWALFFQRNDWIQSSKSPLFGPFHFSSRFTMQKGLNSRTTRETNLWFKVIHVKSQRDQKKS